MGEWRYSSTILGLGARWRWVVSFRPLRLYHRGKRSRYPLDSRLAGPQSRSESCGEEKNLALPGIEPGSSNPSLYRLNYPDRFKYRSENHLSCIIFRDFLQYLERNHDCLFTSPLKSIKGYHLHQCGPTRGPRAACGPLIHFVGTCPSYWIKNIN
jgi:hypothetical protein